MSLFLFKDYRSYLTDRMAKLPKKGHGELTRMAEALGVHSTLMSMILSGQRELTVEQGYDLAGYLGFTELETEYFSLLVQSARAGNHRYQAFIDKKLEAIRKEATQLSKRIAHEKSLSDHERAVFYSSWLYSAIRNFTATSEKGKTVEEVAERFKLPRAHVVGLLEFLVSAGLVKQLKDRYQVGPQRTFIEHGSPHLLKHHSNWRIKALEQADRITTDELMFTSPFSIAKKDFKKVRELFVETLKHFSETVKDSPSEEIACLNIDLFWIRD
jgi:uncharacterized protein (TIGR02147 family)